MRKGIKIALKLTGYILLLLILSVIIIPLMFKDEIIDVLRRSVSEKIEGDFYFDKAQVGLLRTFPNLCVHLTSPVLTGGHHPYGDSLFVAKSLDIVVDIKSVLKSGGPVKVVGIDAIEPRMSLYTDKDGNTNYQLVRTDTLAVPTDTAQLAVDIQRYELTTASLKYVDVENGLSIICTDLDHEGKLLYKDDVVDLRTKSSQGILTIISGGTAYVNAVHFKGNNDVRLDLANAVYTLQDNSLFLNALQVHASGSITQSDSTTMFDLALSGERSSFKDLLSLLPNVYSTEFNSLQASGNIAIQAGFKGMLSEKSVPVYRLQLSVDNGAFQYPGKPMGFDKITVQGTLHNSSVNWMPSEILLPKFHFELNHQPFDANVSILHPDKNPAASGTIKGQLDLANIAVAYPMPGIDLLEGTVDADVAFDIDASRTTENQQVTGQLLLNNFRMHSGEEQFSMQNGNIDFNPKTIHARTETTQWNGSSIKTDLTIRDFIEWMLLDQEMMITGDLSMDKLDMNRYLEEPETARQKTPPTSEASLNQIRFAGNVSIDSLIYDSYVIEQGKVQLKGTLQSLDVVQTTGMINGTRFTGNGNLRNIDQYMAGATPLAGSLECSVDKIYVERWLDEDAAPGGETSGEITSYTALPENITLDVAFRADDIVYDKIRVENARGDVHLENQILEIHDFNGHGIGGDIEFSGLYNTQNIEHPAFNMKYGLKSLRFNDAFQQIETFRTLAPIAKFVQGVFNSDLVFAGNLGKNYMPDFSTLTASGFLETLSGSIQQADVLQKVSQFLNLKQPLQWNIANSRNWFEIKDGYVLLQEMTRSVDGIEVKLGGRHRIQGEMDYLIKLNIPADRVSSNPVGALAKAGYEQLQSKASAFGVKLNTIENFVVHVAMRGKLSDPKFEILLFDASGKSLKDVAAAQLTEIKTQVRDTLTGMAEEKIQVVKDSVRNVVDAVVDSARRATEEKLKETGKELVSQSTAKLDSTLRDSVTNAILNKLGDKAGQKETDKIKNALDKWDPFKKKKKDQ